MTLSTRQPSDDLIAAGRFGTLTMLSPKALRLYAERGLLQPAWTDPTTGYRWYAVAQVATGRVIALLRGAEMPLDRIEQVVGSDPGAALDLLDAYASELDRRRAVHHAVLERVRRHYREDRPVTTDGSITTATDPGRAVLSAMRRPDVRRLDEVISTALQELRSSAEDAGLRVVDDPFGIYHGPVTEDSDGPLEICVVVEDLAGTTVGDQRSYRLPGGRIACRRVEGDDAAYPAILVAYEDLAAWVETSGHQRVGPPREVWHEPTDETGPAMTICWPFA